MNPDNSAARLSPTRRALRAALRPSAGRLVLLGVLAVACQSDYDIKGEHIGSVLSLEVTSPTYGEFMGDSDITVTGTVYPRQAVLTIEGETVEVSDDGSFSVSVPVDYAYRIVDIEAHLDSQAERIRLPVFQGHNPADTWPGGMSARLLPSGLDKLGVQVGAMVDGLGWKEQISAALPSYTSDFLSLTSLGVTSDPTVVLLEPALGGLDTYFTINNVLVAYQIDIYYWIGTYTGEMSIGFTEVAIGGLLVPTLDEAGILTLELTDASLDISEPDLTLGPLDGTVLEWVMGALNDYILEPLVDLLLGVILDQVGVIEVGGPFDFSTDLFGTSIDISLASVFADLDGLGALLGMGIGEPIDLAGLDVPVPGLTTTYGDQSDVAIGVHEGLLQLVIVNTLDELLGGGFDIGSYAFLLDGPIRALPGGSEAPEGAAWCLAIDPGTAYVARFVEGTDRLGAVYMPDFLVDIGIDDGATCNPWLKTSLAMELGLVVEDGTNITFDMSVREGAVLEYGASEYDEAEVVSQLGTLLSTMIGLVGGSLSFNLTDLVGGLGADTTGGLSLGELAPTVVGTTKLYNTDGTWNEGLYALCLDLWAD